MNLRQCNNCGGFPSVNGESLALEAHTCPHGLWCELDGCEKCIALDWKSHPMRVPLSREERLARARERMAKLRDKRKAKGMCIDCEAKTEGGAQCCAGCQAIRNGAVADVRTKREASGACVGCGGSGGSSLDTKHCDKCLITMRARRRWPDWVKSREGK